MTQQTEWADTTLIESTSLCTPAVRMVVIEAWHSNNTKGQPDQTDVWIHPVVALRSVTGVRFTKEHPKGVWPMSYGTRKAMTEAGWEVDGGYTEVQAMIVDEANENGVVDYRELQCCNSYLTLHACPWPPEQDKDMLCESIKYAQEQAKKRA